MKDYQDFGKFNNLKNTLTNSRSNISLSSCLLFYVDEDMYTYKVGTTKKTKTCNF